MDMEATPLREALDLQIKGKHETFINPEEWIIKRLKLLN